jgi:hypothetical protein
MGNSAKKNNITRYRLMIDRLFVFLSLLQHTHGSSFKLKVLFARSCVPMRVKGFQRCCNGILRTYVTSKTLIKTLRNHGLLR